MVNYIIPTTVTDNFFGSDLMSRLTLVFFISKLDVNAFPIQRLRRTI